MDECDADVLLDRIRRAVREEVSVAETYARTSVLPISADLDAELLLIGAALYGKRAPGVGPDDFYAPAHRELYAAALEGGTWADIRRRLTGDPDSITVLYERLRAFEFASQQERQEAAEKVVELAARRRLREVLRRLEVELAYGQIDALDAEDTLQRHILKGYQ